MSACPYNRFEQKAAKAFTLLELLVVITIIGILAAVGLPAIRGMTKSNALVAADRQLLDDLGYARLRAIADHTTVYVVFVPPNVMDINAFPITSDTVANTVLSNLYSRRFNTYALISLRSVGDQPGQSTAHYLSDWRTLPNGVYIATNKFTGVANLAPPFSGVASNFVRFPFPTVSTNPAQSSLVGLLPYIAFNYQGQLCCRVNSSTKSAGGGSDVPVIQLAGEQAEYIPLVRGSIFYTRNGDGTLTGDTPDVQEAPTGNAYYSTFTNASTGQPLTGPDAGKVYNQIHVDPLTGRPHVETLQVQ